LPNVTVESWEVIAEQLGITDTECTPQREFARKVFGGKL
jgi:hypothetical protein